MKSDETPMKLDETLELTILLIVFEFSSASTTIYIENVARARDSLAIGDNVLRNRAVTVI